MYDIIMQMSYYYANVWKEMIIDDVQQVYNYSDI
jgi:hypothetical protein